MEDLPGILLAFQKHNKKQPSRGYVVSSLHNGSMMLPLPPESLVVNQKPWTDIGRQLGGLGATGNLQFTRCTVAACWAIDNAAKGDKIILVGFDNVYEGVALATPQDHQGNPLRPSELAGLMRANAEALFQDILGKPLNSSFKNTYNLRGKEKTPPPESPDGHGP